jgi:chlorophyllide a reductase subunit Z
MAEQVLTAQSGRAAAAAMTIKEIHRPSAVEGALWAVQGIRDARVIFHAPPGCYMMQHMNALCNEWQPDFYSTLVSYAQVMMGTEETLERLLEKVAAEHPAAIIVVTSPVIEITGDDVEGVARKVGFDRTLIVRPPLGATLADGKEKGLLCLLDLMQKSPARDERAVNLIGPTYNTFNWRADVFELKRMLASIGVRVNAVLAADTTVAEISRAPQAALNICMYPLDCGIETARRMEELFGIPYVGQHVPIGFGQSAAWLDNIARRLGIDARDYLSREMQSALEFSFSLLVSNTLFESSCALSIDNCDTYSVGISRFLHTEMGMEISLASAGTPQAAEQLQAVCGTVLVNPSLDEKKAGLLEKSPTIILGNYYDLKLATDLGFKNFLFADIPLIGYVFSENRPFMGFMGAKNLVESITNEIYMKIFIETKGQLEGAISAGEVAWDLEAERALGRIAELLPHFVRSIAIKKIHQVADEIALREKTPVTLNILREVTNTYTPTRFKAKYATIFADMREEPEAGAAPEPLFTLAWDQEARQMLSLVPEAFRAQAVAGTEEYARQHQHPRVTAQVAQAYRKELGF